MRAGAKIDSQSADENLESLEKFGIDLTKKPLKASLTQSSVEMKKSPI